MYAGKSELEFRPGSGVEFGLVTVHRQQAIFPG
jgi:hypothetical protein